MIGSFLLAVATSTVLATLLNQSITQWREWQGRREAARLSAIYAVSVLMEYCEQCAYRRGEKDTFISSDGHAGTDFGSIPDMPPYPAEIDWKRLGIDFTERMFALRARIASAQSIITDHYEHDPPDGGDVPVFQFLTSQGVAAISLAREIAAVHRLKHTLTGEMLPNEEYLIESEKRRVEDHHHRIAQIAQTLPAIHGPPVTNAD